MSHPDDELLVDLALGSDEPKAREHLDHCDECACAVAELRRAAALLSRSGADDLAYAGWSAPPAGVRSRVAATITAERSSAPGGRADAPDRVLEPDRARRIAPRPESSEEVRGGVQRGEHGRDHSGEHGESPRARVTPLRRDRTTQTGADRRPLARLALGCRHGCRGPRHRPGRRTDALTETWPRLDRGPGRARHPRHQATPR